jgi:hypothetical protein
MEPWAAVKCLTLVDYLVRRTGVRLAAALAGAKEWVRAAA